MDEPDQAALLARAQKLEEKRLFVKAAEIYLRMGEQKKAASAYENGGDFEKAIELFEKLGLAEDAGRCLQKKTAAANQESWDDLHAKFQADLPYQ